jgi:hypothetical protein
MYISIYMKLHKFVIYKIYHKDGNIHEIYIGSTVCFSRRKSQHKKNVNNKRKKSYHTKLYKFIRLLGGWDNFIMEIIEEYPCDNMMEGKAKEQYYIDLYKPTLNSSNSFNLNI